jgi:hypothetical protein
LNYLGVPITQFFWGFMELYYIDIINYITGHWFINSTFSPSLLPGRGRGSGVRSGVDWGKDWSFNPSNHLVGSPGN